MNKNSTVRSTSENSSTLLVLHPALLVSLDTVLLKTLHTPITYVQCKWGEINPILPRLWKDVVTRGGPLWPPPGFLALGPPKAQN